MAASTVDSLLELLEKSNLLTEDQLAEARAAAEDAADPKSLARSLVQMDLISRWQAGQLLAGRSTFFLGKYKLIELLGRGGMGGVFLARHTMMNRPVALKVVSKQIAKDPAALERFLTEARAIAALDDPNIVQAYNVDSEDGRFYIVMEYVEGKDLQKIVEAEGPLDFERAADYIRQAADGLSHAHSRELIHCDVKPSNLLVNGQGVVKILDLGMARVGSAAPTDNGDDERVLGTVDYLAPEQAMQSKELDHRADIYSLGCTFYFLLTGKPPFGEGSIHQRIVKHQTKEAPGIAELRPSTPKDLIAIVRKMMAKKPEDRFQSASEVSSVLADWRPRKPKLRRAVPLEDGEEEQSASALPAIKPIEDGKPAPAVPRPAEDAPAAQPADKVALPRWVLIAGAAGAVVLVGLVIALAVVLSSSPRGKTGGPEKDTVAQRAKARKPVMPKEESDFPKPKVVDSGDPGEDPTAKPDGESKPEPKPAEKPADKPEPKAEEKPKPKQEKPHPKTEEKPRPKEEGKPKPKEKEEPKPKTKPKPVDPLQSLPKAVSLPLLDEKAEPLAEPGEPTVLAKFNAPDDASWDLSLIGGENAVGSNRQFLPLDRHASEEELYWTAELQTEVRGQDPTKTAVAKLWREKGDIKFQWLPGAEPSTANCLKNCLLEVYLQGKTRQIALSEPVVGPPLDMDLTKGFARVTVPLQGVPDDESLRLEITGFEGQKSIDLEPAEPVSPKTPLNLYISRTDAHNNAIRAVSFRVTSRVTREGLSIDCRLVDPPVKAFRTTHPPALRDMLANKKNEIKKKLDKDKDKKQFRGAQRSQMLQQIDLYDRDIWYLDFQKTMEGPKKISYRVFIQAGLYKIELAKSPE